MTSNRNTESTTWFAVQEILTVHYVTHGPGPGESLSILLDLSVPEIHGWARNATTGYVWLGLCYGCSLDTWYWLRGETVCYENWAPGRGNGRDACGTGWRVGAIEARGDQQWVSLPDTEKHNFICSTYEGEWGRVCLCVGLCYCSVWFLNHFLFVCFR